MLRAIFHDRPLVDEIFYEVPELHHFFPAFDRLVAHTVCFSEAFFEAAERSLCD